MTHTLTQGTKDRIAKFSRDMRNEMVGRPAASALASIPKNRRTYYEHVLTEFEERGEAWSVSGMTVNIVAVYLRAYDRPFVIEFDARGGVYIIREKRQ